VFVVMSDLKIWIKAQQDKGYSNSDIEQRLLDNGFDKETIDKLFLDIALGVDLKKSSGNNKGTFLWLGISLLILIILVGGAYYYMQTQDASSIKSYINNNIAGTKDTGQKGTGQNTGQTNLPKNSTETIIDMTVDSCGNNILESGEECDGNILGPLLNESKCSDFRWNSTSNYRGGNLLCVNCKHDFSMCAH
jgi:hypothetical protein